MMTDATRGVRDMELCEGCVLFRLFFVLLVQTDYRYLVLYTRLFSSFLVLGVRLLLLFFILYFSLSLYFRAGVVPQLQVLGPADHPRCPWGWSLYLCH